MKQVINLLNKHEAEKDKMATKLNAEIAERIEGLKMLDRYVVPQQTNDALIEELKDRIIELEDNLEIQRNVNEHMIKAHKAEMAQLKEEYEAKIAELINDKLDDIVKKHVEGGDAMEQPKAQPKKNNSPLFNRLMNALEEEEQPKEETVIEETKEETTVKINWTQDVFDKKVNDFSCMMMGVHGDITINDKNYKFKARREYSLPIVYSFDEEVVRIATEEINKIDRFKLAAERTTNDINSKYAKDKEYPIKVWRLTDDKGIISYNGFTKDKANKITILQWGSNMKHVVRLPLNKLNDDNKTWKTLRDNKALDDKFRAVCADIWPEDFAKEVPQDTNEIVVDFTNDPTAGCDDLDI